MDCTENNDSLTGPQKSEGGSFLEPLLAKVFPGAQRYENALID